MYFGKWCDMFAEYRNFYNFKTKRCLFEEKKEVSLMDLYDYKEYNISNKISFV